MSRSASTSAAGPLITVDDRGLFCRRGGFWIDPWKPVPLALITHAHADHARSGSGRYRCAAPSLPFLSHRLAGAEIAAVPYGEHMTLGECTVSFHPAGHVAGSAQIRVEADGEVWVVTGDYKRDVDPSCEPFEPVACDVLITEATFGLPVYRWPPARELAEQIVRWWKAAGERPSILFCYAFGKTQRILAELARLPEAQTLAAERGVFLHGAAVRLCELYTEAGYELLPVTHASANEGSWDGALVIAPPGAHRSAWMKRFPAPQTAFASGWMNVRGIQRRRGYERGFVLSDHADWDGLVTTVRDTGAQTVYVTHGQNDTFARYLREEMGLTAAPLQTLYEGEEGGE